MRCQTFRIQLGLFRLDEFGDPSVNEAKSHALRMLLYRVVI